MKTKSVDYFYPTSPNSERFKMPNGGWVVRFGDGAKSPNEIAAFTTQKEAIEAALKMPEPWSHSFLFCHPEFKNL